MEKAGRGIEMTSGRRWSVRCSDIAMEALPNPFSSSSTILHCLLVPLRFRLISGQFMGRYGVGAVAEIDLPGLFESQTSCEDPKSTS
jgi:hypothetical protein